MVNEKYLLVAKNLADRNKNRLNTERSLKEQEKDELFYWIIGRLEFSVQGCSPGKASHHITVKQVPFYDSNRVLLEHGRVSQYLSQYVTREEFYSVMQEVAETFNEIGKQEKDGYDFYAVCITTDGKAELTVHMTTFNHENHA